MYKLHVCMPCSGTCWHGLCYRGLKSGRQRGHSNDLCIYMCIANYMYMFQVVFTVIGAVVEDVSQTLMTNGYTCIISDFSTNLTSPGLSQCYNVLPWGQGYSSTLHSIVCMLFGVCIF